MSKRSEHLFQFPSEAIANAAEAEAEYHEGRQEFWQGEQKAAADRLKEVATVEVKKFAVTGGERIDLAVNYGDLATYRRLGESFEKLQHHRAAAERFRSDAEVYGTQNGRSYELDTDDVHHFRLHGGPRED